MKSGPDIDGLRRRPARESLCSGCCSELEGAPLLRLRDLRLDVDFHLDFVGLSTGELVVALGDGTGRFRRAGATVPMGAVSSVATGDYRVMQFALKFMF